MTQQHYINDDRVEALNERIALRNVPSSILQPQFSLRPVATKYALLPIVDRRAPNSVPLQCYPTFDVQHTFNPGTGAGPWCGFAKNVNNESLLRNQFAALQSAGQAYYIPPTTSDLYMSPLIPEVVTEEQPFPFLFEEPVLAPFNPNVHKAQGVGINLFDNCTRQQLKQI